MNDASNSPGAAGSATLQKLEATIIRTRASAFTVSRLVEEVFDSPHPSEAARRYDGMALLIDSLTHTGLTLATIDMLRHVQETADAFDVVKAEGGAA